MILAIQETKDSYGLKSELPDVFLETPLKLLDMVSNHHRSDPGSGPRLPISNEQRDAFEWLLGLRNGFMHFQPQSWSIAISDLRPTFLQVIEILKVVEADGHSFRHLGECDQKDIENTITLLEKKLSC